MNHLRTEVNFNKNHIPIVEVYFKQGPDSEQSLLGSASKYWSKKLKTALGITNGGGFPYQLMSVSAGASQVLLPISAVPFRERHQA